MAKVTVQIDLPDELVDQAKNSDMLDPDSLALLVRYELENYLAAEDGYQIGMPPEYREWMSRIANEPVEADIFDDIFETELDSALAASQRH